MKNPPSKPPKTPQNSPAFSPAVGPDAEPFSNEIVAAAFYHGLSVDKEWVYVPLATSWWRFRISPEALMLWGIHIVAQRHPSAWRACLEAGLGVQVGAELVMMGDGWGFDELFARHPDAAKYISVYGDNGTQAFPTARAWLARRTVLAALRAGGV